MTNESYLKMIADRDAAKAARKAELAKANKARKAEHKAAIAEHAAKQVGPFFCICCKTQVVEKFDIICSACDKSNKEALDAWYAEKPRVVGTF